MPCTLYLSCSNKTCNTCRTVLILTLVPLENVVETPTTRIPGQVACWWRIMGMAICTSQMSVVQELLVFIHISVTTNTRYSQLRWGRDGWVWERMHITESGEVHERYTIIIILILATMHWYTTFWAVIFPYIFLKVLFLSLVLIFTYTCN